MGGGASGGGVTTGAQQPMGGLFQGGVPKLRPVGGTIKTHAACYYRISLTVH